MTSGQKLHRALTKLIYEYFEDSYKEYAEDVYDGEYEDGLLSCIYKLEGIAKRYHKDRVKESHTDYDCGKFGVVRIPPAPESFSL